MNERGNFEIEKAIKDSLDKLDANLEVKTPDMSHFRAMIKGVEEGKRRKLKKETVAFWIVAIVLLTFETLAFHRSIIWFITTQVAAVLCIPIGILLWKVRLNRRFKGI